MSSTGITCVRDNSCRSFEGSIGSATVEVQLPHLQICLSRAGSCTLPHTRTAKPTHAPAGGTFCRAVSSLPSWLALAGGLAMRILFTQFPLLYFQTLPLQGVCASNVSGAVGTGT